MENTNIAIHLILKDGKNKNLWQSPNHNDKSDDYHGENGLKNVILADVRKKIKKKFGKNCNVEIYDGKIILVSQLINGDGKRENRSHKTGINAEDYFDQIMKFVMITIFKKISIKNLGMFSFEITRCTEENLVNIAFIITGE